MVRLDDNSRKVLRVIYNRGMVRGRDVLRMAGLKSDEEFRVAVDRLTKGALVMTHTGSIGMESVQAAKEALFAVQPSRKTEAEYELRQAD